MSLRRSRSAVAAAMSASLVAGLAVAGWKGSDSDAATSVSSAPEGLGEPTVATTPAAVPETSAPSESAAVEVLSPGDSWAGLPRGEWDARSWQWLFSMPEEVSPWFDPNGERCGYGQFGPVFFVAQGWPPRTCVVAEGTAIYVRLSGVLCSTVAAPPWFGRDEPELAACANTGLDEQPSKLQASVNGHDVADLDAYRTTSPLFTITLPEDNLSDVEPGVAHAVSAAYSFMIAPPSPGEYEIAWTVRDSTDTEPRPTSRATVIVEAPQVVGSGDPATSLPVNDAGGWEPDAIAWAEMTPGLEDGYLDVPIDYAHPEAGMAQLYLWRRPADEPDARVGTLVVPTAWFVHHEADRVLDDEVLASFDIVGFDRRGTGLSAPVIDCIDDLDHFYAGTDITPDDDGERQQLIDLAPEFADACVANNAEILQYIGTNNAARDIDSIRRALGEDEISYYSYWGEGAGAELGGVWVTMFPDTVRAAVLDAAPEPNDYANRALVQAQAYEQELVRYLADCSAAPRCAFHNDGDAEAAFDELMEQLDETPIPDIQRRPDITRGVANYALVIGLITETHWSQLSGALNSAQQGLGSGLRLGYDIYFNYNSDGTWPNHQEVFETVRCMDSAERLTIEEADANAARLSEVAPRLHPPGAASDYVCTFFPEPNDPRIEITGAGAGPILVCGPTEHPATPLQGTRAMAEALEDSYLITIDARNAWCAGYSQCADDLITDYLINLDLPADPETYCTME